MALRAEDHSEHERQMRMSIWLFSGPQVSVRKGWPEVDGSARRAAVMVIRVNLFFAQFSRLYVGSVVVCIRVVERKRYARNIY